MQAGAESIAVQVEPSAKSDKTAYEDSAAASVVWYGLYCGLLSVSVSSSSANGMSVSMMAANNIHHSSHVGSPSQVVLHIAGLIINTDTEWVSRNENHHVHSYPYPKKT